MKFRFKTLTHSPERMNVVSAKLGATTADKYSDKDVGKAMKMGTVPGTFLLCADGDEIQGRLNNIDAGGTEDGFVFGGVACGNRGYRVAAEYTGTTDAAVLDLVVAAAQPAIGTAGGMKVKAGTPATHKWRIIDNGKDVTTVTKGDMVVLELL